MVLCGVVCVCALFLCVSVSVSVPISPDEQSDLKQLFNNCFSVEEIEFKCAECDCSVATMKHQLSRLPR